MGPFFLLRQTGSERELRATQTFFHRKVLVPIFTVNSKMFKKYNLRCVILLPNGALKQL